MKRQLASPRAESCKEKAKEMAVNDCATHQKKYHVRRDYSKSSPSTPVQGSRTSRCQIFFSAFKYQNNECVKEVSKTIVKTPNSFKLSNLFGFNDFKHLSARSRNKLARQEVNDSDNQTGSWSKFNKNNQWWQNCPPLWRHQAKFKCLLPAVWVTINPSLLVLSSKFYSVNPPYIKLTGSVESAPQV